MPRVKTDLIIVHCSATPASMDVTAAIIDGWHRQLGWMGIGYHFLIRRDGTVESGRTIDEPGAHAEGYNNRSVGICLAGGTKADAKTPENNFTPEQFAALAKLILECLVSYPGCEILGHCAVSHKACPCFDVKKWCVEQGIPQPMLVNFK